MHFCQLFYNLRAGLTVMVLKLGLCDIARPVRQLVKLFPSNPRLQNFLCKGKFHMIFHSRLSLREDKSHLNWCNLT